MRKLVASLMISMDGVVESPGNWQFDYFDNEMFGEMNSSINPSDAVLLGRKTYEEWNQDWPNSKHEPYASYINNVQKFVISKSLKQVEWGKFKNISLINHDLVKEIKRMKILPGGKINVAGSPTLVFSLLESNLLDSLTLIIFPVIVGKGKKLFKEDISIKRMKLIHSKETPKGVIILTYEQF